MVLGARVLMAGACHPLRGTIAKITAGATVDAFVGGFKGIPCRRALTGNVGPPPSAMRVHRSIATQALRYHQLGPPEESLRLETVQLPTIGPRDALVEFLAAPINPADLNIIEGKYPLKPPLPAVAGMEGVAVVCETGSEVPPQELCPGDRVVPLEVTLGTWRMAAVLPAAALYKLPSAVPVLPASTLTINPPTALCLLEHFVDLRGGDVVVQNGANSGVGQAVIEVAASRGVKTINVVRKRHNWDEVSSRLQAMGGTIVTSLDEALELSSLPKPKLALDCVGGESASKIAKMLRPGGTMVTYGGMSRQPVAISPALLIFKDLRLRGFALSMNSTRDSKRALLDRVVPMAQAGMFAHPRYQEFRLDQFRDALAACSEGYRDSKVILRSTSESAVH